MRNDRSSLAAIVCLMTLLAMPAVASVQVQAVRLWRAPDHTRVVLDLSGPTTYKVLELANPSRLVLDVSRASLVGVLTDLPLDGTPIARVRSGIREGQDLRVVFDLTADVNPRSFQLSPNERTGHRLVLDLFDAETSKRPAITAPKKTIKKADTRRPIVVAIDAGHGGEDPGATGPKRLREKHVVLQIANRLKSKFEASSQFRPVMIRTGDYYITHKGRRDLARKNQADLFISIHADAFTHPSANGASVYALSTRGASSTTAQYLADKENAADLVGGVAVSDMDDILAGVLTDLSMTGTLDSSLSVGAVVLGEMGKVAPRLHKTMVEQAAFLVLKSPDIPSILVEAGFISNPEESSLLATPSYQDKMAGAIFHGVEHWFKSNPPPGTVFARSSSGEVPGERRVKVVGGDTLSGIAAKYAISVDELMRSNSLPSETIIIGQVLIIPESG